MPRRENTGRRRLRPVPPRRTILVYCGGRTERDYIEALKLRLRATGLTVKTRHAGVAPEALIRSAAAYRDRKPGVFDEVWCVVDVDEFDIAAADVEAGRQAVRLAVSNPCFELRLLLHHADCRAYCDGYRDVCRRLVLHVPHYDKAGLDFTDFADGVDDAVRRAMALDPTGKAYKSNPSSGVWQLVETIRKTP